MDVDREWFESHDNLVALTAWMAEHGSDAREVAYAVEKPWKFQDEFDEAMAEQRAQLNAEAAARDTAEVAAALADADIRQVGADDPCPEMPDGSHSWEPDEDVLELRSGDGMHCEECGARTVYDKYGGL